MFEEKNGATTIKVNLAAENELANMKNAAMHVTATRKIGKHRHNTLLGKSMIHRE